MTVAQVHCFSIDTYGVAYGVGAFRAGVMVGVLGTIAFLLAAHALS